LFYPNPRDGTTTMNGVKFQIKLIGCKIVKETHTEEIVTPGGIRQGDSLSPFLFNLLMDRIIEEYATTMMQLFSAETEDDGSSEQNHRASLTIQMSGYGSVELARPSEGPKKPDQQRIARSGSIRLVSGQS